MYQCHLWLQLSLSLCHTDLPSHLALCLPLNFPQKHKISLISCADLYATSQKRGRQWLGQSFCWCSSLMSCFEGKTLLRSSWASLTVTLHRSFSDLFNFYKPTGITSLFCKGLRTLGNVAWRQKKEKGDNFMALSEIWQMWLWVYVKEKRSLRHHRRSYAAKLRKIHDKCRVRNAQERVDLEIIPELFSAS